MTLAETLRALDSTRDDLSIFARRPWTEQSDAVLVRLDEDCRLPPHVTAARYEYFLDVYTVKNEVLGESMSKLNQAQRCAVVRYYAEHDALPEWFYDLCQDVSRRGA